MEDYTGFKWENTSEINNHNKDFTCWNCVKDVSSSKAYFVKYYNSQRKEVYMGLIYICHKCNAPNIFNRNGYPIIKPHYGKNIDKLPNEIREAYNEARKSMQVGAYTAASMILRKILMNVAVIEGAKEGDTFKNYIDYLYNEGIIHKKQKGLIDKVREIGNEANHEIKSVSEEDAQYIFKLIEHLLLNNYEFIDNDNSTN
ncbi:hypothetical protein SU45_00225 [Brachyspira hyodysenteriae]|uniref:DUF4145 domain-containing protein n=4 Tax=Brachyspira TaxID=29521 RepID=UPI00063D8E9A|nr:DUF4145 domain-containing protein [Brachyspira hyodysenteriae]KLI19608.1 hypothetical protein SU45_00225 [Brachyspira hyodysenteriae]